MRKSKSKKLKKVLNVITDTKILLITIIVLLLLNIGLSSIFLFKNSKIKTEIVNIRFELLSFGKNQTDMAKQIVGLQSGFMRLQSQLFRLNANDSE